MALEDTALVTVDALEQFLGLDPGDGDEVVLEDLIHRATAMAELYAERQLAARAYTDQQPWNDCEDRRELRVAEWPVNRIDAIRTLAHDFTVVETLDADEYRLDPDGKTIWAINGTWPARPFVQVDYNGGFGFDESATDPDDFDRSLVPHAIQRAVLIIAADQKEERDDRNWRFQPRRIDQLSHEVPQDTDVLPRKAKRLLDQYRRISYTAVV